MQVRGAEGHVVGHTCCHVGHVDGHVDVHPEEEALLQRPFFPFFNFNPQNGEQHFF